MEPSQDNSEPTLKVQPKVSENKSNDTVQDAISLQGTPDSEKQREVKSSRYKFLADLCSRFQVPSWLFSAVFHGIAIAILAVLTVSTPVPNQVIEVEFYAVDEVSESLVEVEFEMDSLLDENIESDLLSDMPVPDMSEITQDLQSQIEPPNNSKIAYDAPSEFSRLYRSEGNAMPEVGGGMGEVSGKFLGTPVRGRMTVIFDITASMFASVPLVLEVLDDPQFANAQVYAVFGGSFRYPQQEVYVMPYQENSNLHYVELSNTHGKNKLRERIYQQLITRKNTLSIAIPRDKKSRQSLGVAIDAILRESRTPNAIFVFSDFEDGVDRKYMQELLPRIKKKRVSIVFYHPKTFKKNRDAYKKFADAIGGEIKEKLFKQ